MHQLGPCVIKALSPFPQFTDPRLLQQKPRVGPPSGKEGGVKPKRVDRLQDKSLQEMKDDGFCLSMHQPWAALLVAGIKRYFFQVIEQLSTICSTPALSICLSHTTLCSCARPHVSPTHHVLLMSPPHTMCSTSCLSHTHHVLHLSSTSCLSHTPCAPPHVSPTHHVLHLMSLPHTMCSTSAPPHVSPTHHVLHLSSTSCLSHTPCAPPQLHLMSLPHTMCSTSCLSHTPCAPPHVSPTHHVLSPTPLAHEDCRCEGRSWHSTHRGRLWIAATRKEPSPAEIEQVQQFYVTLYGSEWTMCGIVLCYAMLFCILFSDDQENLFFPLHYPTSCLLGCVDVLDCLPKEEYQEKVGSITSHDLCSHGYVSMQEPQGESESEYVFIVDNPQELTVKFPIAGQHKICT